MKRKILSVLLALAMVLTILPTASLAADEGDDGRTYLSVEQVSDGELSGNRPAGTPTSQLDDIHAVESSADPDEVVRVSIVMDKPSTIAAGYSTVNIADNAMAMRYRDGLYQEQATVQSAIERQALGGEPLDVVWNMTLAANIISANVRRGDMEAIAAVSGVDQVFEETQYSPDVVTIGGEYKPNMGISTSMTGAVETWDTGYTGAGTTIAIIDTGLDLNHQSFDEGAFNYAISKLGAVDLLTTADVKAVFDKLNIKDLPGVTADSLYRSAKVPFAYNYVDKGFDVSHDNDSQGEHGSHVAGIAAANRYIPVRDAEGKVTEYKKAIDTVQAAGNAPDAQVMVMKVFGSNGGAYESDYVVAIEDALILGADVVNLSLGSSSPGFATNANDTYQKIFNSLENSDTVVSISAGNSGSWADYTPYASGIYGMIYGITLYNDGVSFDTVGSPGSFANAFTVASVDNMGYISPTVTVEGEPYSYYEGTFDMTADGARDDLPPFASLDTADDENGTELEFIMLSDETAGYEAEALKALAEQNEGIFTDKVVIVWRGTINFAEKARIADEFGAKGLIIANIQREGETATIIRAQLNGYTGNTPVATVTQDAGEDIWREYSYNSEDLSFEVETGNGEPATVEGKYIIGKMTVKGTYGVNITSSSYTMSDFSSWGVPGDLSLKPEITAPGGNIWSVLGSHAATSDGGAAVADHDQYELMSGTSMAAPQIAGLSALVQQYISNRNIHEDMTARALTQALIMSTAAPMKNGSSYYPVFQQGAGLVNALAAVTTPVYITVAGQTDGKVKAELGDDPDKTGVYTVDFTLHNMTESDLYYALSADVFTQGYRSMGNGYEFYLGTTRAMDAEVSFMVSGAFLANDDAELLKYDFNGDGNVDSRDAQLLLDHVTKGVKLPCNGENANVSKLEGGDDELVNTYDVHCLLKLGQAYARVPAKDSVDVTAVITLSESEKTKLATQNPAGAYVEAYITANAKGTPEGVSYPALSIPVLGYYGSWTDPSMYDVGSYTGGAQRNSYLLTATGMMTNFMSADGDTVAMGSGDCIAAGSDISGYYYSLIRNAVDGRIQITNAETGELYWQSEPFGREYAAYYGSTGWQNARTFREIGWDLTDADGNVLPDGTEIAVSVIMVPEYYAEPDGTVN